MMTSNTPPTSALNFSLFLELHVLCRIIQIVILKSSSLEGGRG